MALIYTCNAKEVSVPTRALSVVAGLLSRATVQKTLWLSALPLLLAVTVAGERTNSGQCRVDSRRQH